MSDIWEFWRRSLLGEKPETTPGTPHAGFYRDRSSRAVAIWKDGEQWVCSVTSGYCPRHKDEIDELFGFVCRAPITRELFMHIKNGGGWPEDVQIPERGAGDNSQSLPPHELLAAQINDMIDEARKWLASIGGKIATQEHADKAANFAGAFGELEKEADKARKNEKEPHDKAAKAVQAKWLPVIELAAEKKSWLKKEFEKFALAEKRRREEEARRLAEEQRKAAEEAARAAAENGEPPPQPEAIEEPAPVKNVAAGTRGTRVALKTRVDYVVIDLPAFAAHLAALENPPPEFLEACRKIANRLGAAGANPPGVEKRVTEFAA
ncbi:hypothetical protein C4587_00865 [Candidatus Parcubacteria bacterium]|nr:MAG: hypothetical protein C4587_00865 [Candidatus Parcubacteria bacterium]